jgi:hypothetical protein
MRVLTVYSEAWFQHSAVHCRFQARTLNFSFLSFTTLALFDIRFLRFIYVVLWLKNASFVREQPKQAHQNLCVHLSRLFFLFRRFCFFFQFGNQLPYPFYFSRVSFTQLWRSNGFPFLSHCRHSTFTRTNLAFSFEFSFPFRFIMFRFHIRSPLVQA